MYKIALCDDDISFYNTFESLLSQQLSGKNVSYKLKYYPSVSSFQEDAVQGASYDLIFLDILMGADNGIDFARQLRSVNKNTNIIFVTSSPEFALDGYDVAPLHYLVKPVNYEKLEVALNRFFEKYNPSKLLFKLPGSAVSMAVSDILYFEIFSHQIVITKINGENVTLNGSLKDVEQMLPCMTFMRPHKSYLVNMQYIAKIARYQITLGNGKILPIAKGRYLEMQNLFIEYADQKSSAYR